MAGGARAVYGTSFPEDVEGELRNARKGHGDMASLHEAIAVIREEYLELEAEIFKRQRDNDAIYAELVQLAAMCQRTAEDLEL